MRLTQRLVDVFGDGSCEIAKVLVTLRGEDITAYVRRRKERSRTWGHHEATVRDVCRRFRMRQALVVDLVDAVDSLALSNMAYLPPKDTTFAAGMMAQFWPRFAEPGEDVPMGSRLVVVIDVPIT